MRRRTLFRWASLGEQRPSGMPSVRELEAAGWTRAGRHPIYGSSVLMYLEVAG